MNKEEIAVRVCETLLNVKTELVIGLGRTIVDALLQYRDAPTAEEERLRGIHG